MDIYNILKWVFYSLVAIIAIVLIIWGIYLVSYIQMRGWLEAIKNINKDESTESKE